MFNSVVVIHIDAYVKNTSSHIIKMNTLYLCYSIEIQK